MSAIDVRTVSDLHAVPERIAPPPARRRGWGTILLRVFGGFMLTGFFLALSGAAFVLAGIYGFLEFARLY